MKVRRKFVRYDCMSVEKGKSHIGIHTHRNLIVLSAYEDKEQVAWHEFTFEQLLALLRHPKRCMTPTREAEAADALDHVKGWLETLDASLAHARNDIATALVWIGNFEDQIKPKKKRRKK